LLGQGPLRIHSETRAASGARPGFIRHMSGVDSRFIRGIRG
jgi:hypothetical protein